MTTCGTTTCQGSVFVPQVCDGTGACKDGTSKTCAPFGCNAEGSDCATSCATDADCASGAKCNKDNGECEGADGTCADDFTAKAPGGALIDCTPYRCSMGGCKESCDTTNDCAAGYACADGKCQQEGAGAAPGVKLDKGCGCELPGASIPARSGRVATWLVLSAALLGLRRRRRRRSLCGRSECRS